MKKVKSPKKIPNLKTLDDKLEALKNWGVEVPAQLTTTEITNLYNNEFSRNKQMWENLEKWGVVPAGVKLKFLFKKEIISL